jgi:hypothetical protein
MNYSILRFVGGRPTGDSETWTDHPLDAVNDHARQIVKTGLADRVEVRDGNGKLVFQWPRTVSRAPSSTLND